MELAATTLIEVVLWISLVGITATIMGAIYVK